jgi:HK97 family phage portal protein
MGFVGGALAAFRARSGEESTLARPGAWLTSFFGGGLSKAGVAVNENTARNLATVWACTRAVSEDVAKLPLKVYRRVADEGREALRDHPVAHLLNVTANTDLAPAMGVREFLICSALLWGNGFAEIERAGNGRPLGLWPWDPSRVKLRRRQDGRIEYLYREDDGSETAVPAEDVFHLRGPSKDGLVGANVIALARESLGSAMAADQFTARFWSNGARPSGALKTKKVLSPDGRKNLRESIQAMYSGAENAGRVALLEEDMDWVPFAVPPNDAQFLETKAFSVDEICRWFRVPPHKVAKLDRATFSNIEHQAIEYVTDGLGGWMARFEQEANLKLLTPRERGTMYVEHLTDALLRGDLKARYEAYAIGRQWGWLSVNDVRRRENQNAIEQGDQYLAPANMTTPAKLEAAPAPGAKDPATDTGKANGGTADPSSDTGGARADLSAGAEILARAGAAYLQGAVARVLRIEADRARRALKLGLDELQKWADGYYAGRVDDVRGVIFSGIEMIGTLSGVTHPGADPDFVPAVVLEVAERHVEQSVQQLGGAIMRARGGAGVGAVEEVLTVWERGDGGRADADAAAAGEIIRRRLGGQAKEGICP